VSLAALWSRLLMMCPSNAGMAVAAAQERAAESSDCDSAFGEGKAPRPRGGVRPARRGPPADVLATVAQHPYTLRFRDAELERQFGRWHASSQRVVRGYLLC